MHACRLTTDNYKLRELTINYTLASHTLSVKSVASESTYIIGIYKAACAAFSISDLGEL